MFQNIYKHKFILSAVLTCMLMPASVSADAYDAGLERDIMNAFTSKSYTVADADDKPASNGAGIADDKDERFSVTGWLFGDSDKMKKQQEKQRAEAERRLEEERQQAEEDRQKQGESRQEDIQQDGQQAEAEVSKEEITAPVWPPDHQGPFYKYGHLTGDEYDVPVDGYDDGRREIRNHKFEDEYTVQYIFKKNDSVESWSVFYQAKHPKDPEEYVTSQWIDGVERTL